MNATISKRRALPKTRFTVKLFLGLLTVLGMQHSAAVQAQDASKLIGGTINTFAGSKDPNASQAFDGVPANNSQIPVPYFTTLDADGNLYFSYGSGVSVVYGGNKVPPILALRVPSPQKGYQYRIAGFTDSSSSQPCTPPSTCGDGGPALAQSGSPNPLILAFGMTVDAAGNLYIADETEQSIRKVSAADGTISTIAGDPMHAQNGYNGDGRTAVSALLSYPNAVKFDSSGNLYIADGLNYLVRRIDTSGNISTIAGNVTTAAAANGSGAFPPSCSASTDNCGEDGAPLSATLGFVFGMNFDAGGNLFLAESDISVVREITLSSQSPTIHTVAGTLRMACSPSGPAAPFCGDGGPATSAQLNSDSDVVIDAVGNVFIADQANNAIRLVTASDGNIQTIAGQISASGGYSGDGGLATAATLNLPEGLILDTAGVLYITDQGNSLIRSVTPPPTYSITFPALAAATYGTAPISLNATVDQTGQPVTSYKVLSGPGRISGSTLVVTGEGSITVEADQPGDSNYAAATPVRQTVTIAAAVLTVTANNLSRAPGTANPPLTYTITGFVNGDTSSVVTGAPVLTTTATTSSPFGSYPITVTLGTLLASNYNFTTVNGTLSVTQALAQTITFAAIPNVTYGANALTLSASASPSNLPVTLSATGPVKIQGNTLVITGAGAVVVTANQQGNLTYAAATPVTQSFTIAPAPLTITPADASRAYNAANPAFSFTATGLVYGDTLAVLSGSPIYTTTATSTSDAGKYPITAVQGNLFSQNYTFTFKPGTLTITQASQTITFGDVQDLGYQNTETITATSSSGLPIQLTASGPVSGVQSSSSILISPSGLGPVTVTAKQSGNLDYAAAPPVTVSFNVVRSPLNVFVSDVSRPVGSANPTFQYSLQTEGLKDPVAPPFVTGIPDVETSATQSSPPGTYPIVATTGTLTAEHYYFVFNNGTLTVTSPSSYIITTTPTSLTVPRGSTRQLTVTVSQVNNYAGSVTLGCGGLPAGVTCSFSPAAIVIPPPGNDTVTGPIQGTLTITATGSTASVSPITHFGRGVPVMAGFFVLPAGFAGLLLLGGSRRFRKNFPARGGLLLAVLACVLSALTACGSAGVGNGGEAVPGTTMIQITGVGTANDGASNLNQSVSLSLTVQ